MSAQDIIQLIFSLLNNFNLIAKILLVPLIALYLLYALILTRQIFLFSNSVTIPNITPFLKLIAIIHAGLATFLLFYILFLV